VLAISFESQWGTGLEESRFATPHKLLQCTTIRPFVSAIKYISTIYLVRGYHATAHGSYGRLCSFPPVPTLLFSTLSPSLLIVQP
jgi:hypothetical protein